MSIVARFDGRCPACDEPIHVGQRIAPLEDTEGPWGHASCDEAAPRPDRRRRCPFCADLVLEDGSCGCSA